MKQTLLLLSFMLVVIPCLKSQEYVPFPTRDVNWNVYLIESCAEEEPPDTVLLQYTIHGDTTINDVQYRKLCIESDDTANPLVTAIGGLREENKKIYYQGETLYLPGGDVEYLLYDFTVDKGDTIIHDPQGDFFSVVQDIDSIMIAGNYRKRYTVDNHWFYQNLIKSLKALVV